MFMNNQEEKWTVFTNTHRHNNPQLQIHLGYNPLVLKWIYLCIICASLWWIIFLLQWKYFWIETINIKSPDNIWDINIAYKSLDRMRWKNIFLLNKNDIKSSIQRYQTNIATVSVKKQIPNTLTVYLYSYPIALYANFWENDTYAITSNGVAIPKTHSLKEEWKLQIKIQNTNQNNVSVNEYKSVLSVWYLNNTINLIESFKNNFLDKKIQEIILFQVENELHIIWENKTHYIFDLKEDVHTQIKKLAVYTEKQPNTSSVYIDLRIKDTLFDCQTDMSYQCQKNLTNIYSTKKEAF